MDCKVCEVCGINDDKREPDQELPVYNGQVSETLFCDKCDRGYHQFCLVPPVLDPQAVFICPRCLVNSPPRRAAPRGKNKIQIAPQSTNGAVSAMPDSTAPSTEPPSSTTKSLRLLLQRSTAQPQNVVQGSSKDTNWQSTAPTDSPGPTTRYQGMLHVPQNIQDPLSSTSASAYTAAQKGKGRQIDHPQEPQPEPPKPYGGLLSAKQAASGSRIPLTEDRRLWNIAVQRAEVRSIYLYGTYKPG